MSIPCTTFFSISVYAVDLEVLCKRIDRYLRLATFHQIATVNPEFLVEARKNAKFRATLQGCDLCIPDGVGLVWLSWLKNQS